MATCPTCRTQYAGDLTTCPADGGKLMPDEMFGTGDADLSAGMTVGEYQVEGKLGEGGFGVVYRAQHPLIGKLAAIKVLNRQWSSNPEMVSRFIAEARSVNQIRHRNIIDIFAFGALEDGRQYYVMELLEGMPLDRYLEQRGRLPAPDAVAILRGVARALDAAHECGVAHRDLKPENIFLEQDRDGAVFPKLLDFGIAKLLAEGGTLHKTRTGAPIGTPAYMSPEQCRGKSVDHRTDIYSFGILTYEALTGRLPFDGEEVMDILFKHLHEEPQPLSRVCPDLPSGLDAPVLAMLAKDPKARPSSVSAALEAVAEAAAAAGLGSGEPSSRGATFRSGPLASGQVPRAAASSGALGEAKTVAITQQQTLQGAASDVPAPRGRRWLVLGGVGAAAAAAVAVAVLVMGGSAGGTTPAASSQPSVSARPVHTASAIPAPASSASALVGSASATGSSAAAAAPVDIEILGVPEGTDVFLGEEKLGTIPGMVHVASGSERVRLTLRKEGYRDLEVEVTPDKNRSLSAPPMVRAPVAVQPPPPTTKKADKRELEDPGL